MPSLPLSPPSAPTFAASQLIGLVVFVVVVLSVSGLYFLGLHVRDKLVEGRIHLCPRHDSLSDIVLAQNACKPDSVVVIAKEELVTVGIKTVAAAAALVAARANLPVKAKAHVAVYVKGVAESKVVPRTHLRTQLDTGAVSARFGTRQTHVRPGPSPLRVAVITPERIAAPPAADLVSVVTFRADPVIITPAVAQPPLAVTLANFIPRAYHAYDSDSDDDTIDEEPLDFDGLRMVRSTENSWMPVRAGSRQTVCVIKDEPSSPTLVPAPAVLGASQIVNASLRHAVHVKRPSVKGTRRSSPRASLMDKENAGARAHIQVPRRVLLA
ncbi:hypothetical protein DFH09DRAFT_1470808 [Mycena vulgaris]|nr:hypothetical protein DFH09DRAFT_1470808 [Mycena vulgaris]